MVSDGSYGKERSPPTQQDAEQAGRELASLFERQLGLNAGAINGTAMRLMVLAYWNRISMLSHTIHDAKEEDDRFRERVSGLRTCDEQTEATCEH